MKQNVSLIYLSLQLLATPVFAQNGAEPASADQPMVQEISAVRDPEWKSYRQMLKGVDAFDEYRQLAPKADLRFVLRPDNPALSMADLTLRIAGTTTSIPVPIAADGTFSIPRYQTAIDEDADLLLNRRKNAVRWRTEIHTPEVPANARRLGDLRLSCRVNWAVLKDDMPFLRRTAVSLAGGPCGSSLVKVYWAEPRPLASATLVEGERRLVLSLGKDGVSYSPPLTDQNWGDDALVIFEYVPVAPKEVMEELVPVSAAK